MNTSRYEFLDVNECETAWNDCDAETTECVDTVGSFECQCLKGFEKIDSDKSCYGKQ